MAKRLYPTVEEERELKEARQRFFPPRATPAPCGHCACVKCENQTTCNCTVKIYDDCRCVNHEV